MDSLDAAIAAVDARRQTLEVYSGDRAVAAAIETQFATRNVTVTYHEYSTLGADGFLCVRDDEGAFAGAVGLDTLSAILSPEHHPPWELSADHDQLAAALAFLDNTLFASFDRRQLLATTREIEERAWRVDQGTLYVGFQRPAALETQAKVYERIARERTLAVRVFLSTEGAEAATSAGWLPAAAENRIDVTTADGGELGRYWFVIFDGGERERTACGLVAEEFRPGQYTGFWTYDPASVDELVTYLTGTYPPS